MANIREVFTVLEKADGSGESWKSQAEGDAVASVELAPVVTAKDKDGNFALIPIEIEGEAIGNAVPVLPAKDVSGNLAYLPLNADGELIVSAEPNGTLFQDEAVGAGVINTDVDTASITLSVSEVYEKIEVITSCTFSTLWKLVQIDDATTTVIARWLTGPGSFSFDKLFENLKVTAGASGTQELKIVGVQLQGTGSDLNAYMSAIEKA